MSERGAAEGPAEPGAERDGADEASADAGAADEGLLSQLALIDDQPLGDRARAFAQLHDALRQQLEA